MHVQNYSFMQILFLLRNMQTCISVCFIAANKARVAKTSVRLRMFIQNIVRINTVLNLQSALNALS